MEAILGIDLAHELSAAEAQMLDEKRERVRKTIGGIVTDLTGWKMKRNDLQKEMDKLDQSITKAEDKYKRIKDGDWSVLNDNMFQSKPTSEKGDAKNDVKVDATK